MPSKPARALSLRGLVAALCLLFAGAALVVPLAPDARAEEPASAGPPPTHATIVSVYDGDTFTLDTGDRVRLSGANTPELKPYEPFASEARDATEAFVSGKQVQLHYGPTVRDHYGRLIASVTVDGQDLAQHLLERGLAHVFIVAPCDMDLTAMLAAQGRAREAKLGLWADSRYQGALHITSFHANGRGDDPLGRRHQPGLPDRGARRLPGQRLAHLEQRPRPRHPAGSGGKGRGPARPRAEVAPELRSRPPWPARPLDERALSG